MMSWDHCDYLNAILKLYVTKNINQFEKLHNTQLLHPNIEVNIINYSTVGITVNVHMVL